MTIEFVGNVSGDFQGISSDSTTTRVRDSAYSNTEINIPISNGASSPVTAKLANSSNDVWMHFRVYYTDNMVSNGADGTYLTFLDSLGGVIGGMSAIDGDPYANVPSGSNGVVFPANNFTDYTVDIHTVLTPTSIVIDIYFDSVLVSTGTRSSNPFDSAGISEIYFNLFDVTGATSDTFTMGEMIVTSGEDTRGWRLATLDPISDGNYTDFSGDFSDLITATAFGLTTDTVPARQSWNLSAYTAPATTTGVRAVINKLNARRGTLAPANVVPFVRIGGVDYDGTAHPAEIGNTIMYVMDDDPSTSLPWDTADIASVESGALSSN